MSEDGRVRVVGRRAERGRGAEGGRRGREVGREREEGRNGRSEGKKLHTEKR